MAEDAQSKIRCEKVWKIFGREAAKVMAAPQEKRARMAETLDCTIAVQEASFDIAEGEVFVIMGLSGSGKSTILRCINHLIPPTAGRVWIDGRQMGRLDKDALRRLRQQTMGMVFQNFALLPYRSVLDNVAFGLEVQGISKKERFQRAQEALELVGLSKWGKRHPHELSGGMQQRVGLARALALNPEILLMDEAFSALDPLIRKQMQEEFLKLVAIVKKTIVFITHDLDEALNLADRIAVMKDGRIVQIGSPEAIVTHPADDYVRDFVSSVSRSKVISARHLMAKPEQWISAEGDDPIAVLNKMRKNNLDAIFITNGDNRLVGVMSKNRLKRVLSQDREKAQLVAHKSYVSVLPDSNLEEVVSEAANTQSPIAVIDESNRLVGVISRSKLLNELADVL